MNHLYRISCAIALLASALPSAGTGLPLVVPVEGERFGAGLAAVDAKWQLTFGSGDKLRVLPAADLVLWGSPADAIRGPILLLADGGLLLVDQFQADSESLTADSGLFGTVKLPLETLAGIVFDVPAGSQPRDLLLDRVSRAAGGADRLLLHNGDQITGLLDQIKDDAVTLKTDVGPLTIETDRIAALIFNPDLRQETKHQGLRAWTGLADGSRLIATQLILEGATLQITAAGQTWKTSAQELVFLQPLGGRVTYLSELKPADYRQVPFLDLDWPYQADRNVTGGRLRSGGRLYLKGLGTHSAARLTYRISEPYQRFQAELAVDDSAEGAGSVRFRVLVDDRQQYTSQTIRGGMAPVPVSVDLSGAKRLDLIVDYADQADVLDHADWLNARLVQ